MMNDEWLYLRIYSGKGDDVGLLLPEVTRWMQDLNGIKTWHFLRYVDVTGHHLRLRMCGKKKDVNSWYNDLDRIRQFLAPLQPRMMKRVIKDPFISSHGSRIRVDLGFYAPEFEKYSGVAGMNDAEWLFNRSSNVSVERKVWEWDKVRRLGEGVNFIKNVDMALGDTQVSFASSVLKKWERRAQASGLHVHQLPLQAPRIVNQISDYLYEDFDGGAVEHAKVGMRYYDINPSYLPDVVHMHINRIGLNPLEEFFAAYIAEHFLAKSSKQVMKERAEYV